MENKHHSVFGVAHRDTLKDKRTALPSIKHGGNAFHIY